MTARIIFIFMLLVVGDARVLAVLANAWHIPDNSSDLGGTHMREPWIEISNNPAQPATVTIYSGVQKLGNPFGTANQTGGTLFYKGADDVAWQSVALGFHNDSGNNQYWKATFSTSEFAPNEVIQYCLYLTFDSGAENTYIYAPSGQGDKGGATTNSEATAKGAPFTVRNRPGWIFHANNRVVSGGAVQFWAKVGYIGDVNDLATRWATNGALYYTTDGSTPSGSLGEASGTTQVATFAYDHPETSGGGQSGGSVAGTAMWWRADVASLPAVTTIKYKVGFWNAANNEEKFGDYNAGDATSVGRVFSFSIGNAGDPVLTVNGLNANYTTSKLFVDEVAGDVRPLVIVFEPGKPNVTAAEVFTNFNRRDRAGLDADGDGFEDGIEPVNGDLVTAGSDAHYFKAYTMTNAGGGQYTLTLDAGNAGPTKTGAYRLTARFKVSDAIAENSFDPNKWIYYTDFNVGRRDHAITVSPVDARNIRLYEINVFNIEADGASFAQRSTFEDLHNAPGAPHNGANRWDLDYLLGLGCNWLWFQPVHPVGIEGRENDPGTSAPYDPGSPYAVKNFFEINELMSVNYNGANTLAQNRAASMTAFQNFVAAADAKGVGVMLDAPFNHTGFDAELAQQGVNFFAPAGNPGGWSPTDTIKSREARFYSRTGDYSLRAFDAGSIATAPDRGDFGKWNDVKDVHFGRYAALVDVNPGGNGNYTNEGDWFDYSDSDWTNDDDGSTPGLQNITRAAWKYFAEYTLHWLTQTGVPAGSSLAVQTAHGIDGLRADFGQGLPPQLWEYISNKTRARKWNFVFMAESLDGGAVTYRSNRHFDILNENIVFPLKSAGNATNYRDIFESRRSAYGQGLVLLNNTSHDEENYDDPWHAVIRYSVCAAIDGVPLIFPGQELGISRTSGYSHYETNFGKQVAHFKKWNSMDPIWDDTNFGRDQLYHVYAGMGRARAESPALRASNRYFIDTMGGGAHSQIFSVAKYETANASPGVSDVVFAFANLNRGDGGSPTVIESGTFNVNITQGGSNLFGIKPARTYNVRNRAAYTAQNAARNNAWLWGSGRTGSDVLANGVFVAMNKVPTDDPSWTSAPFEAQYLKLYDVTPPPTGGVPGTPKAYALGTSATFSWTAASDPDGGISGYRVIISTQANGGGTVLFDGIVSGLSKTITGTLGQTLFATVKSINNAGIESTGSSASASGTMLIDPAGDEDGDGQRNDSEDVAGTDPFSAADVFKVVESERLSASSVRVRWSSVAGVSYEVLASTTPDAGGYGVVSGVITASGTISEFTDHGAVALPRYYKVRVVP